MTILIGYLVLMAIVVLFFASFGALGMLQLDANTPLDFALGLGSAYMWYALILVATSRLQGRGGMIAGLSWAAFFAAIVLWQIPLPTVAHFVFTVLNYINPLAWFGDLEMTSHHRAGHIINLPDYARTIGVWIIAAVATATGVRLWATREA